MNAMKCYCSKLFFKFTILNLFILFVRNISLIMYIDNNLFTFLHIFKIKILRKNLKKIVIDVVYFYLNQPHWIKTKSIRVMVWMLCSKIWIVYPYFLPSLSGLVWHKLKSLVINDATPFTLNIIYKDQNVTHSGEKGNRGVGRGGEMWVIEVLWKVKNRFYKKWIIQVDFFLI